MKTFYSFIAKIFLVFSLCGVTMAQAQGLLVTDSTVHTSYGEATGSITLTAQSDSSVRYLWSTSDTSHQITGLTVGDYSVTVTAGPDTFIHTYTIYYYVTWSVLYNVTESAAHELVCTNSIAPEDILGNYAYGKNVLKEDSNGVVMFHFKKGKAFSGLIGYTEKNFEQDDEGENQAAGVIVLTDSFADIPPGISILTGDEPMYLGTFDTSQDNTILVELRNDTAFLYKNGVLMLEFDYGESVRKVFPFVVPIDSGSYVKDVLCNYYSLRLEAEVEVTQLSCPGNNGSIDISISGGFPPYSYEWSNSATTASISSLDAGTYILTVTDDSNDELILSYDLSFPVQWDTLINFDEETDGSLTCTSSDPAYAIGTNSLTSTQEGWVTFEIAEGEEFSGAIGLLDRLTLDEANLEANLILIEDSDMYLVGKAIDEVYLGSYIPGMPYIIRMELADDSVKVTKEEPWGDWGTTTEVTVFSPHTVDVYPLAYSFADGSRLASIRSSFGCGNLRVGAEIFPAENIGATGSIYATVKGGTPPYTYAWSNGGASANLTNVSVGNYTLTVTDNTSATVSKTFLLGAYSYWDELDRMIETPEHVVHTDGSPYQEGGDYPLGFARGYNELRLDSTGSLVFEFTSGDDYGGILGLLQYPALEDTAMEYIAIGLLPDSMEDGHQMFILHNIDEGEIEYIGLAAKGISQRFRIVVGLDSVTVWKNELSSVTFPHTRTHNLRPMIAPILEESYVGRTLVDFGCVRPEPPTPPAPQSVCSDTAYTFTWDSIQVGLGGDSIEWSLNESFSSSTLISSYGSISHSVASGGIDTVWMRSIVASNQCKSKPIYTIGRNRPNAGTVTSSRDTVCPTKGFNLFVTAYSGDIQWQQKDTSNIWADVVGATNDTLLVDSFWATTSYRVIVSNDLCGHDTSSTKIVHINTSFECIYEYNWYYILVHIADTNNIPVHPDSLHTRNDSLNDILDKMLVTKFYKPFYNATTSYLDAVYAIYCNGDVDSLYQLIDTGFFDNIQACPYFFESICTTPVTTNDPYPSGVGSNWAIEDINAECAWSITSGDPNIVIANVDGEFETTHEDLNGKFVLPLIGTNIYNPPVIHGTLTSSCITANNNNGLGIAGIGGNIKIGGYLVDGFAVIGQTNIGPLFLGSCINPFPGIWAAYQDGRKVINVSASGIACPGINDFILNCDLTSSQLNMLRLVVQEITANGTNLVLSAGNSENPVNHEGYSDIPGVVIVGAVNALHDCVPGYSKYPEIDLCAPGVGVPVANASYDFMYAPGSTYVVVNGTSLSAPMVSGTIGLMLSINPCLGPQDVEAILRSTTNPIANASYFPGLTGTGRLDAYQACLAAQSYTTYINATQDIIVNTIWNHPISIFGDVTIRSGVTLTISNTTIFIAQGRNIYIEPGAKLIINDATLTGICGTAWNGIIVEGNPNQHQYAISGSGSTGMYHQGAVFLNDAIIEHAVEAVKTDAGKSGGIIQATTSTFRNNYIDIRTFPYRNFQPGNNAVTKNNVGRFDGCSFITNGGLTDAGIPTPLTHALLFGVHGVRFRGCVFANDAIGLEHDYELGNGITSLDATYTVDYWCPPPHTITCPGSEARSEFRNLRHGVYNLNWFNAGSAIIRRSLFENCVRGVRNEGVNNLQVTGNEFIMGNPVELTDVGVTPFGYDINEGIILHQCSGFKVEGNKFTGTTDIDNLTELGQIGIRADGTGPDHNDLRNNKFEDMRFGNVANRQNRQNPAIDLTGLEYTCNGNDDGLFDFYAAPQLFNDPQMALTGIQLKQGDLFRPADNTFSGYTGYPILTDFLNLSGTAVTYYYQSSNPGVFIDVVKVSTAGATSCNYDDAGEFDFNDGLSGMSKPDLQAQFSANKSLHRSELALRKSLIDEGSTANMLAYLAERDNSTYSADVYDTLIAISPWLSEKVLKKAATMEEALVNTKLWDVIMANPDATASGELIMLLQQRTVPMPDSLIDSIIVNRATITTRTYLEDSIKRHVAKAKEAAYEMSSRILTTEDTIDYKAYRQWADSIGEPRAAAEAVMSYFNTSEIDSVLPKFDSIYVRYELTHEDSAELNNIRELLSWYVTWINGFDSLPQADVTKLDSSTLAAIDTFAATENEFLKGTQMARSLMNTFYGGAYYTLPQLPLPEPEARKSAANTPQIEHPKTDMFENGVELHVYPNPAKEYVTFALKGRESCTIDMYDLYSRKVSTFTLIEGTPLTIATSTWPSGVYLWKSSFQNVLFGQGKLNVMRW